MKEWTFYELDTLTTLKNFVSEPFIQRGCWQAMIIGIHRSHGYFSSCLAHLHRFSQASKTEVYVANKHDHQRMSQNVGSQKA